MAIGPISWHHSAKVSVEKLPRPLHKQDYAALDDIALTAYWTIPMNNLHTLIRSSYKFVAPFYLQALRQLSFIHPRDAGLPQFSSKIAISASRKIVGNQTSKAGSPLAWQSFQQHAKAAHRNVVGEAGKAMNAKQHKLEELPLLLGAHDYLQYPQLAYKSLILHE